MTLPSSGQLTIAQINTEFGRGLNLGAYRGVQWWTDTPGQTGVFESTNLDMAEFYGKRATAPTTPGLKEFTGLANFIASNGNNPDLGAPSADRFIIVCAGLVGSGNTENTPVTECTVGGVPMTLLVNNTNYGLGDNATAMSALFVGNVPNGTNGEVVVTRSNGNRISANCSLFRVRGDLVQGLGKQASAANTTFNAPASSVIIGVCASMTGGTQITWSGLTRYYEVDRGTWRFSSAYQYYGSETGASVQRSAGTACFANIFSP